MIEVSEQLRRMIAYEAGVPLATLEYDAWRDYQTGDTVFLCNGGIKVRVSEWVMHEMTPRSDRFIDAFTMIAEVLWDREKAERDGR